MPIIPKSETPQRALQSPGSQTPNSGGALVGEGMQTLGRGIDNFGQSVLQVADKFTLMRDEMEADNRLAEFRRYNTKLMSSPTADEETGTVGLLNTFGAATLGASQRYGDMTDKKIAELEKGLSPRALQAFRQSYLPVLLTGFQSVQTHEGREARTASEEANMGVVKAVQADAINNYTTPPEVFEDQLGEMATRLIANDELNGLPTDPKALKAFQELQGYKIKQLRQQTIAARVATAIEAKNVSAAEAVMESHGAELDEKTRLALDTSIGGFYATAATQNAVRWAVHLGGGPDRTKRQVKDQAVAYAQKEMKLVGRSLSVEQVDIIEKAAEAEYDDQVNDSERIEKKATASILTDLEIAIQQNGVGEGGDGYIDHQGVKAIYFEVLNKLATTNNEEGIAAANEMFNAWRENPSMGGFAAVNDPSTQIQIDSMTDHDLAKMTDAELALKKPKLTKARWTELSKARAKVLSGKPPVENVNLSRAQVQERVAQALKSKQLVPSLKTSAYSVEDAQLLTSTVDLVFSYAGQDATPESIQRAIATAVYEQSERQVGFFGSEFFISPAELLDSPNRVPKSMMKTLQSRYGYSEEQLEDVAVRRMALTQYYQDEAKRRRRKQLNDGKFEE